MADALGAPAAARRAARPWRYAATLIVTGVAFLAACSSNNQVGNQSLLNGIQQKAQNGFDTTTTARVGQTLPPAQGGGPASTAPATTTKRPQATTPTTSAAAVAAATVQIGIYPDNSTSQFSPSSQPAYVGTPVKWTNKDTVPRSVVSDDGSTFSSGPIPPGGTYTWAVTGGLRRINYHDGTRPYAVADLDVIQRP